MIYTLEWIKKEAIEIFKEEEVNVTRRDTAQDLLIKVQEVEDLVAKLDI